MGTNDLLGSGIHALTLTQADFRPAENPEELGDAWRTFVAHDDSLTGHIHVMASLGDWCVLTRDLMPKRDMLLEFDRPGHLSIAWYDSISGEEFTPYRKLRAHSLWGFHSGRDGWSGLVHAGVPLRSVAIEASPAFVHSFVARGYPGRFSSVGDAFASLDAEDVQVKGLERLLLEVWPRGGDHGHDVAWYGQRVTEALQLVVDATLSHPAPEPREVSPEDRERIHGIASYVDDHYINILKVPDLARVAHMSPTKFKECFKAVTGSTLTRYIQRRRISQAEQMLHQPALSIEQISHAVGYTCVSRFSELFRRETGMLPSEYRRGL